LTEQDSSLEGAARDPARLIEWIQAAKRGNIDSFRQIYDRFARKVLNFVFRMAGSAEEAEDLTQETFMAVYQKLGSLKDDSKFEPWLFRIARNLVYQRYRSRPPTTVPIDAEDEDGRELNQVVDERKTPEEAFEAGELGRVVQDVISGLPDKYREVFILSALQHLSYQEISEIVGRSLASVKTDIHRARLNVRRQVKEYLSV